MVVVVLVVGHGINDTLFTEIQTNKHQCWMIVLFALLVVTCRDVFGFTYTSMEGVRGERDGVIVVYRCY